MAVTQKVFLLAIQKRPESPQKEEDKTTTVRITSSQHSLYCIVVLPVPLGIP
jgi:hypothetical protein